MKRTKFYVFICSVILIASEALFLTDASADLPGGITAMPGQSLQLFDSQSLFGWATGETSAWSVDGEKNLIGKASGSPTILRTTSQFSRFFLRIEFKTVGKTTASILFHTDPKGVRCDEQKLISSDQWREQMFNVNTETVFIINDQTKGGSAVVGDSQKAKFGRGYIGIRLNEGTIVVRNIELVPMGLEQMFNGKNLDGWKSHPVIEPSVNAGGELEIRNGNGSLESSSQFADMELQFQVFVDGDGLNSGVFFRCIPGEKMNGYECQIQNQFTDNDRTRPKDCGTGGIFRRTNARCVMSNDREWTNMYINAVGNRLAVWVNGIQVTDWVDTRKADANPRRGLRTEAGTVQLQAHDPTTNLRFRNISGSELPKR